jgi:hypothetical protein
MRIRTLLLVGAVVAVLVGCSRGAHPNLTTEFPAQPELHVDAMAVTLIDQTGLVTGIRTATPADVRDGPVVETEPAIENGLRISWPGNGCDRRLTLVFGEGAGGYDLAIHIDPTPAGGLGCVQVTLERGISITLSGPIDPASVTVSTPFP